MTFYISIDIITNSSILLSSFPFSIMVYSILAFHKECLINNKLCGARVWSSSRFTHRRIHIEKSESGWLGKYFSVYYQNDSWASNKAIGKFLKLLLIIFYFTGNNCAINCIRNLRACLLHVCRLANCWHTNGVVSNCAEHFKIVSIWRNTRVLPKML